MSNIKDIFQSAANYAGIRMMYGTPEQIEDEHRRSRQADNAKPYPCVLVFDQQPAEVRREYQTFADFTVLFVARVASEKINSENDPVFEQLNDWKDLVISGLCKTSGVTGIFPSMFTHSKEKKLLLLSTDKICGLEVKFTSIQIKNC